MVSFCCEIFLLCAAALMLTFFIAGLLFICASSTSITWERTPHPVRRPAFSSHLFSTVCQPENASLTCRCNLFLQKGPKFIDLAMGECTLGHDDEISLRYKKHKDVVRLQKPFKG